MNFATILFGKMLASDVSTLYGVNTPRIDFNNGFESCEMKQFYADIYHNDYSNDYLAIRDDALKRLDFVIEFE
jgi:hypothetical protein